MYTVNTQDGVLLNVMVSFRLNKPVTSKKMVFLKLPSNVFSAGDGISIVLNQIIVPGHKLYRKGEVAHEIYIHDYIVDKIKRFNQYNSKLRISVDFTAYQKRSHHSLMRLGVPENSITFA